MTRVSDFRLVRVMFRDDVREWCAVFGDALHVGFGGDVPMTALRRLLEGTVAPAGLYELNCDQDQAGSGVLIRVLDWQPPEIRFTCSRCNGKGQYAGLAEVEPCGPCEGKGYLLA